MATTIDTSSITDLINSLTGNIPTPTIPTLDYTAPSASDLSSQYLQFLNEAANDPTIINFYAQALNTAKGDLTLAQNLIESTFQNTTGDISANLTAALKTLGLTFEGETQNLENSLNQRGIALTQNPDNTLSYGTTGESGFEVGQLKTSQDLRTEAENRSATQQVTSAGLTKQSALTSTGQQFTQNVQNLGTAKQQAIGAEAGTMQGIYNQNQTNLQQQALQKQQREASSGAPAGFQPTDEYAKSHLGMSLADYYKANPGIQAAYS